MATAASIRSTSTPVDTSALQSQVRAHVDDNFADLGALTGHAGPSTPRKGKRRRGLTEEIAYWEERAGRAEKELEETSATLPALLQSTQERLGALLKSAQDLSLQRYALADKMSTLVSELDSSVPKQSDSEEKRGQTVLEQMEVMQAELAHFEAGLLWVSVLEQVLVLSQQTLDPRGHHPSPLRALPHYIELHQLVARVLGTLPPGMAVVSLVVTVRDDTWTSLKAVLSSNLLKSLEPLQWPLKVDYSVVPVAQRRAFERAYQDLLYLQSEGEHLGIDVATDATWYDGKGLYPLQAMVQPIALRFKYHFQGSRNTNRVDKPEWAFTNIMDRIYEHQAFLEEYVEPLTRRAGFGAVDVKSEFIMLLFPILLNMLRSRIPRLLDTPALLAHNIYQTVVFDDTVRENGFDVAGVSVNEGKDTAEWEGLAEVILREEGWFDRWLAGEKKFAEGQLHDIIASPDAWNISDEVVEGEDPSEGSKATTSSRQVKALIEQVTDRYAPLPTLAHRLPFLTSIQLPLLTSYLSRISGSLDAFESLSSAFVRAVPGALAGNTRSGVHMDQTKLTGGKAGLERLIKAQLSASWTVAALKAWADDTFFIEMSADLVRSDDLRKRVANELLLPATLRNGQATAGSVFDVVGERYEALANRAEDMIVRHVSAEVEADLKQHLTRRWDRTEGDQAPDTSFLHALTTLSSHLSTLSLMPPIAKSRVYRRIVSHLTNHISQRAVYAGWSRFSQVGGQDFASEVKDWINTSKELDLPGTAGAEAPWRTLREAGTILSLPNDAEEDEPTFGQAMAVAWSDSEESLKRWRERTGMSMGREEMKALLRRRAECWR